MNEEIIKALRELREGAPEAFRMLCEEVEHRGMVMSLSLIALVIVIISAGIMCFKCTKDMEEGEQRDVTRCVIVGIGILVTIVCLINIAEYASEALSPGLTLIETIR